MGLLASAWAKRPQAKLLGRFYGVRDPLNRPLAIGLGVRFGSRLVEVHKSQQVRDASNCYVCFEASRACEGVCLPCYGSAVLYVSTSCE